MKPIDAHPHDDELDMLRAGLFDDAPQRKAALQAHLAGCAECRHRFERWRHVAAQFEEQAGLGAALRARRHAALAGIRRPRRALPRPLLAAAAVVAAVALGLFANLARFGPGPGTPVETVENVPDFYTELDFYLWLAEQPPGGGNET